MAKKKDPSVSITEIDPIGKTFQFDLVPKIIFRGKNISDSILEGHIGKNHLFNKINIINSVWKNAIAKNANFYNSDIKDCSIKNSRFERCNFDAAAHINIDVSDTSFVTCTFNQTSITDSEFRNVSFTGCDFTNTIISNSRFVDCIFSKCKTSNKLIESSLLLDCKFEEIIIWTDTILENFGIHSGCLVNSKIRLLTKELISPEQFTGESAGENLSAIQIFLIKYFLQIEILEEGSDEIDSTFDYMSWINLSKNANRFRLFIERYHEFIIYNYEKNNAPFWMILYLHKMTNDLARNIDSSKVDIYRSIMGVHMSLSRMVEDFLQLAGFLFTQYARENEMNFLVDGPLQPEFYYEQLDSIFEGRSLQIQKIIKHNSPNELKIIWENVKDLLPVITVFLATRVKLGIQKQKMEQNLQTKTASGEMNADPASPAQNKAKPLDIIRTEFGFDRYVNNYMFKLRAILPGDLLLDLHIELRTKIFGKIKKIILDLLPKVRR